MQVEEFAARVGGLPASPLAVDWTVAEEYLGLALPSSCRELGSAHGPLYVGDWIWIEMPCTSERFSWSWDRWLKETHRHCRIDARDRGHAASLHPTAGGLLACGASRGSETLLWDTASATDPDDWEVVVHDEDAPPGTSPWVRSGLPLLDFLVAVTERAFPLTGARALGPLAPTAVRSLPRTDAVPWLPPLKVPAGAGVEERRRAALRAGSGLAALRVLVPPPAKPWRGDGTWRELVEELGTALPEDYFSLMRVYGAGVLGGHLRFFTPMRTGERGFRAQVEQQLAWYGEVHSALPEQYPHPPWPEPGGLLPFADSVNGDLFCWLTEGRREDWPVVVVPRQQDQGPPWRAGLVETLLGWLRGTLSTPGLPPMDVEDDPLDRATFEPWGPDAAY